MPAESPRARSNLALWIALTAIIALLIGVGAGFAVGRSANSSAASERDAAQAQVTKLQSQLTTQQAAAKSCQQAAKAADALNAQWQNWADDMEKFTGTAVGSPEEAQVLAHLDQQYTQMQTQAGAVDAQVAACTAAK